MSTFSDYKLKWRFSIPKCSVATLPDDSVVVISI